MNIQKTNMLLLDNKIKKEDAGNTPISAPVPQTTKPQAAMNALMFEGMKNLMANPQLAKDAGVESDGTVVDRNAAKSYVAPYSSNMAFQGKASKVKNVALAALMGLAAATMATVTTSCEREVNVSQTAIQDNTLIAELIASLREQIAALREQLANNNAQDQLRFQQQMDMYNKFYDWMMLISNKMDKQQVSLDDIEKNQEATLASLKTMITWDEQFDNYFNDLLVKLANGEITLGKYFELFKNKMDELLGAVKDILSEVTRVRQELETQTSVLKDIRTTGNATYDEVVNIKNNIVELRKEQKEQAATLASKLDENTQAIKDGIGYLAAQMGWSTAQVIKTLNDLGFKITSTQVWTAQMLKGALEALQKSMEDEINALRGDFAEYRTDVQAFADAVLDKLGSIESRIGVFMEEYIKRDEENKARYDTMIQQLLNGNATLADMRNQNNIMIAQNEQMKGIQMIMAQDLKSINKNLIKTREDICKYFNISMATLNYYMTMLHLDINASTDEIIDAINTNGDKVTESVTNLTELVKNVFDRLDARLIDEAQALKELKEIAQSIDGNVSEMLALLKDHFAKYDKDMEELKANQRILNSISYKNYMENKALRQTVQAFGPILFNMANDLRTITGDIKNIKAMIENGVSLDNEQIQYLLKQIHMEQGYTREEIVKRLDLLIQGQSDLADKIDINNQKLAQLNYVVSVDVINAIKDIEVVDDDKLAEAINSLGDKLDKLLAEVKAFRQDFNNYAPKVLNGFANELTELNKIEEKINSLDDLKRYLSLLVNYAKNAEEYHNDLLVDFGSLKATVEAILNKMGRPLTAEELDDILTEHDQANQNFYSNLLKQLKINPEILVDVDLSTIENQLKAMNDKLSTFQKDTNDWLLKIFNAIKALDKTAPDYSEILQKIYDKLANFKCECNCKADHDNNQEVYEDIIGIIE